MLTIAELPKSRRIESREASMGVGSTAICIQVPVEPANSEGSIYIAPSDGPQIAAFLRRVPEETVHMKTFDTAVAFDGTPPLLIGGDPFCVVCGRRINDYANAACIGQYTMTSGTPAEVVCIHYDCTDTFLDEMDAFLDKHTDKLLGDML